MLQIQMLIHCGAGWSWGGRTLPGSASTPSSLWRCFTSSKRFSRRLRYISLSFFISTALFFENPKTMVTVFVWKAHKLIWADSVKTPSLTLQFNGSYDNPGFFFGPFQKNSSLKKLKGFQKKLKDWPTLKAEYHLIFGQFFTKSAR